METLVSSLLTILAILVAIPVWIFFLEIIVAITLPQRKAAAPASPNGEVRGRIAVLVPAHNESTGLRPTAEDIKAQLRPGDRLVVVADNCVDDTASMATSAGAEVVARNDRTKIGKGYALDFGLAHLSAAPPDLVLMIDADCRLAPGAVDELAAICATTRRPVQALYLMTAPSESEINHQVAEFAWRVKNWVRPLGLYALNLPCQLMGTGMAFPWEVIRSADLANGWIVEDLKLGLDLALGGTAPVFCPSARVTSEFASSAKGAAVQRSRWEQGHIATLLKAAPRLIYTAVVRRNFNLLPLAIDLAVPPLSLLGLLVTGLFATAALAALIGFSRIPLMVSAASLLGLSAAVVLTWLTYGRDILPARAILLIPGYVARKLPHYGRILSGKAAANWIRTDRK
jgi:cellulose synthase/poly-beta-1,6-N-acetylglucosamine synthase-like glycosyltransferase